MASKSDGDDFLSPEELIEKYPKAHRLNWTRETIGVFYWSGLLEGYFVKKLKKCFIREKSFRDLMRYANVITTKRLIDDLDEE